MSVDERLKQFPTLAFFNFDHLPEKLQKVSMPFHVLAWEMVSRTAPDAALLGADPRETAAGLRKLLEAKDCAVRAALG